MSAAQSDIWPALYDVYDVKAGDVLNVRSAPSVTGDIIGRFAPDQTNIEVIKTNEPATWAFVNVGEQSGWVSLRYLLRQPNQNAGSFPNIQQCYGTEPFWSAQVTDDGLSIDQLGKTRETYEPVWHIVAAGRVRLFAFGAGPWVATLEREACTDGMSDRAFGLSVHMVQRVGNTTNMITGCCSLN